MPQPPEFDGNAILAVLARHKVAEPRCGSGECRSDLVDPKTLTKLKKALAKAVGHEPHVISAATGDGIEGLLDAITAEVGTEHQEDEGPAETIEWSPV